MQEEVSAGFALTRPPRLALTEDERAQVRRILKKALAEPVLGADPVPRIGSKSHRPRPRRRPPDFAHGLVVERALLARPT